MSHTAVRVGDRPAALALPDLLTILDRFAVDFQRRGDTLALRNAGILSAELREAVTDHKAALLTVCDCRTDLTKLHGHLIRLRCEEPPKGTRPAALAWLSKQIERLAYLSQSIGGTADGWPDPEDLFSDGDQIADLRAGLAEVEAGPYPMPLPPGCALLPEANFDPFAAGRLYSGKLA